MSPCCPYVLAFFMKGMCSHSVEQLTPGCSSNTHSRKDTGAAISMNGREALPAHALRRTSRSSTHKLETVIRPRACGVRSAAATTLFSRANCCSSFATTSWTASCRVRHVLFHDRRGGAARSSVAASPRTHVRKHFGKSVHSKLRRLTTSASIC